MYVMKSQKGQALVALLVFMVVAITITSAAIIIMAVNSLSASDVEQGVVTSALSDGGVENAMLRLLRNPSYSGETLSYDDGTADVEVAGSGNLSITSDATLNDFLSRMVAEVNYSNYIFSLTSWKEEF